MNAPLLPLPISTSDALARIVVPALRRLPERMTDVRAKVLILSAMLQESGLAHRWQVVDANRPERKGPARGLAQFELGTKASRGGVWGVYLHPSSRFWLDAVCQQLGIPFEPRAIWNALEFSDELAVVLARLLLFTDPKPLPAVDDAAGAWALYLRTWRPGKPKPKAWPLNHKYALTAVLAGR